MPSTELETRTPKSETDLRNIAQDIVRRAMAGGATSSECVVREGDEFSTLVRLGQVETLKESGSRSIGVRVFYGQRAASTYSSDFSPAGLDRMVRNGNRRWSWRRSPPKILLAVFPTPRSSANSPAISIFITKTFTPCPAPIASSTRAVLRKLPSISTHASRTPKADRSTLPPATKFSPTRTDLSASTAVRIVRWRRCRSPKPKLAPCSATTGTRWRAR